MLQESEELTGSDVVLLLQKQHGFSQTPSCQNLSLNPHVHSPECENLVSLLEDVFGGGVSCLLIYLISQLDYKPNKSQISMYLVYYWIPDI